MNIVLKLATNLKSSISLFFNNYFKEIVKIINSQDKVIAKLNSLLEIVNPLLYIDSLKIFERKWNKFITFSIYIFSI